MNFVFFVVENEGGLCSLIHDSESMPPPLTKWVQNDPPSQPNGLVTKEVTSAAWA